MHVVIKSFSYVGISIFWQISMEYKVEVITIYRNLVHNLFLLVIKKIFKNLLLRLFVISLSHKSQTSHFHLTFIEKGLIDYLVEYIWILCISDFLIDLSKFATF